MFRIPRPPDRLHTMRSSNTRRDRSARDTPLLSYSTCSYTTVHPCAHPQRIEHEESLQGSWYSFVGSTIEHTLTGRPSTIRISRNTLDTTTRTRRARNRAGTHGIRPPRPNGITADDSPCAHSSTLSMNCENPSATGDTSRRLRVMALGSGLGLEEDARLGIESQGLDYRLVAKGDP